MAKGERFDAMTRLLGTRVSRRQAIRLAVGGAVGGAVGSAGLLALQQRPAGAQCNPAQCAALGGVCCPNTPFGEGVCATPQFPQCCGTQACAPPPFQQCCSGFLAGVQWSPPFCGPGSPATHTCCGPIVCVNQVSRCVGTGPTAPCCLPPQAPLNAVCCGPLPFGCAPPNVCVQYPPGNFQCVPACGPGDVCPAGFVCQGGGCVPVPAPSDRNIKEHVLPVVW